MSQHLLHRSSLVVTLLVALTPADAESPKFGSHIEMPGLPGLLVLAGDGDVPEEARAAFVEHAGGSEATIVVFGMGATNDAPRFAAADSVVRIDLGVDGDHPDLDMSSVTGCWFERSIDEEHAPGVDQWEHVHRLLQAVLLRDGSIGASGGMTDMIISKLPGLNPGIESPEDGKVGVSIDADTALLIRGRRGQVVGQGGVTTTLAASPNRPVQQTQRAAGSPVDLIALSRAAVARAGEEFPPKTMRNPVVESGTLFIGGGGPMPEEGLRRFIDASGGPEALIVIIPTAIGRPDAAPFAERMAGQLRALGATNFATLHTMNPREADTEEFCAPLRDAGGIWFTGGRQWNLVDAYRGTLAHDLFHEVLKRGGAIGGSSAGASIQAEYMVRGHPLGNTVMMAEGYERGLDFLPGVAVDQHFAQRDRFADLASVKHVFPQLLCLGIDEGAMFIVRGSVAEVVGPHNLQVYADPVPDDFDGTEYVQVKPGERYDLKRGRILDASD